MSGFLFSLLFWPLSAGAAGAVLYLTHRRVALDDGTLVRHFAVLLVISAVMLWGTSKTRPVRLLLDPEFALLAEFERYPAYAVIREQSERGDYPVLHRFLSDAVGNGFSVADAFIQARPLLTRLAQDHLDFAPAASRVAWARVTADSLREARRRSPELCDTMVAGQPIAPDTLAKLFSEANTQAFQHAVVMVYKQPNRSALDYTGRTNRSLDGAEQESAKIEAAMVARFGKAAAQQLREKNITPGTTTMVGDLCNARIFQLEAMLGHSVPVASYLLRRVW